MSSRALRIALATATALMIAQPTARAADEALPRGEAARQQSLMDPAEHPATKAAATWRERRAELAALDATAAYQSLHDELAEMESGTFQSARFLILMEKEMPFLLERFGLPEDPEGVLESLHFLCRGRGANRQLLWSAAYAIQRSYRQAMAQRPKPARPKPAPTAAQIVALGDGAWGFVERALADSGNADAQRRIFETGVLEQLPALQPPPDPARLRAELRDAFDSLGYPPGLRPAYEAALDAIDAVAPEESAHGAAAREKLSALTRAFRDARSAQAFLASFSLLREAARSGKIPNRDPDPAFVTAFSDAALRWIVRESSAARAAADRAKEAGQMQADAARQIEAAEAEALEANDAVRDANRSAAQWLAAQQEAVAAYNAAVARVNRAVERVNRAQREKSADLEPARSEAKRLEAELDETLALNERAAREAGDALAEAEARAQNALARAERAQARVREQAQRENAAFDAARQAESEVASHDALLQDLLARLVAGLELVGLRGDISAVGDESRSADERLAGLARWLQAPDAESGPGTAALDAARHAGDSRLRALAALAPVPLPR